MTKTLSQMGLIGEADSNLLTRYVTTWVRWRRFIQTLVANPGAEVATFKDADGKVKSMQPSVVHSIARSLGEELSRAEAALGMSPSARSRIEVAMPAPVSTGDAACKSRFFERGLKIAQ